MPSPGLETIETLPPWRRIRPRIESAMPRRSVGTWSGSKPLPSSRTNPVSSSGSTSTYTETSGAPECRAALKAASWQASTSALAGLVERGVAHHHDVDGHVVALLDGWRSPPRPAAAGPLAAQAPGTARPAAPAPAGGPGRRPRGRRRPAGSGPGCAAPSRAGGRPSRRGPRSGSGPGAPRPAGWPAGRPGPKIRPSPIRVMATPSSASLAAARSARCWRTRGRGRWPPAGRRPRSGSGRPGR